MSSPVQPLDLTAFLETIRSTVSARATNKIEALVLYGALIMLPTLVKNEKVSDLQADEYVSDLLENRLWDHSYYHPVRTYGVPRSIEVLALKKLDELGDVLSPKNRGLINAQLGVHASSEGEHEVGIGYIIRAIDFFNRAKTFQHVAQCSRQLAMAYERRGSIDDLKLATAAAKDSIAHAIKTAAHPSNLETHANYVGNIAYIRDWAGPLLLAHLTRSQIESDPRDKSYTVEILKLAHLVIELEPYCPKDLVGGGMPTFQGNQILLAAAQVVPEERTKLCEAVIQRAEVALNRARGINAAGAVYGPFDEALACAALAAAHRGLGNRDTAEGNIITARTRFSASKRALLAVFEQMLLLATTEW